MSTNNPRVISTSIKLDGEQEFKRQLGDVNSNLRTLKSEMQLTTEEFKGQANSVEALEAKGRILADQYGQQEEKVRALEKALEDVGKVYKDQPKKIDEYQQSLNRAKTELIKLQRELQDNDRYLDEARRSFDHTADSIDGFGKAVSKADDADGGLKGLVSSLGTLKNVVVGGAIATGIKEAGEAILEIVDATEEYRQIMGTLEVSSQAAGYSAEQTADSYDRLYGVLGETQTTATTVANLQATRLAQEELMLMVDAATGAWATYGDSIPIDQLAESINLGAQQSEISSALADTIEWAGGNVEEFKSKLEAANSTEERAKIILQELTQQGLVEAGQAWRDVNADIVANNESQAKWEASVGRLGEFLSPAADALRSFGADAIDVVTESLQGAVEWIQSLISWFNNLNTNLNQKGQSRMESYGYEAYYNDEGLLRYRQVESDLAGANTSVKPAATAADVQNAAAAASYASRGEAQRSGGDIVINITEEVGGAAVARKQYTYNQAEAQRRGVSLVNK